MSNLFYKTRPIIGIDMNRTSIRVASADRTKMLITGYGSIDLDPSKIKDDLSQSKEYLIDRIGVLFKENITGKLNSSRAVLGVPTSQTFARTFSLPVSEFSNIRDAVNLEVEQYIPIPIDQLYIDYQVIKQSKKELTILMCAVPRDLTDVLIEVIESVNIDIAMIEPSINSVARLLEHTKEGEMPTVIVDIGPVNTDIAFYDQAIRVTGGINIGGNTLTLDIAKRMNIPLETAHQFKVLNGMNTGAKQAQITASLRPSLTRIIDEIQKVIRFYTDRFPDEPKLEQLLVVGSGSNVPGLGEFFTNELIMPVRVASPWQALDFGRLARPTKQLRPRFMTSAGLALTNPKDIWK